MFKQQVIDISQDFKFCLGSQWNESEAELVCLPHCVKLSPANSSGCRNYQGVCIYEKKLFIPTEYEGEIHLTYRRIPGEILADAPNAPIDLSPALVHLLPLLTASYLWLDDDGAKAQFYMQMYMEGMRDVRVSRQIGAESGITDTHHWA